MSQFNQSSSLQLSIFDLQLWQKVVFHNIWCFGFFFPIQQQRAPWMIQMPPKPVMQSQMKVVFFLFVFALMLTPIYSPHCCFGGCLISACRALNLQISNWFDHSATNSFRCLSPSVIYRLDWLSDLLLRLLWNSVMFHGSISLPANPHLNIKANKSEFCFLSSEPLCWGWSHFNSLKHPGTREMSNSSLQTCSWKQ